MRPDDRIIRLVDGNLAGQIYEADTPAVLGEKLYVHWPNRPTHEPFLTKHEYLEYEVRGFLPNGQRIAMYVRPITKVEFLKACRTADQNTRRLD